MPAKKIKIIFLGDISGQIGRRAVKEILPEWLSKFKPDFTIANADNLTHGRSINKKHIKDMNQAGIDIFTAGDHTLDREGVGDLLADQSLPILRAANLPGKVPGLGARIFSIRQKKLLVISLLGRVFLDKKEPLSPFEQFDSLWKKFDNKEYEAVLVDLHAEATSEKSAFSWYVDGRAAAVIGTHTHVQTADERILPKGTGAITDAGFCGAVDSVIGVEKEEILNHFLTGKNFVLKIPTSGWSQVNGVYLEIENGKTKKIKRLQTKLEIK